VIRGSKVNKLQMIFPIFFLSIVFSPCICTLVTFYFLKINSLYHHDISVVLIVMYIKEQDFIWNRVILLSKMCLTKPHTKDKVIAVFHWILFPREVAAGKK